jgi:hypothetical protein
LFVEHPQTPPYFSGAQSFSASARTLLLDIQHLHLKNGKISMQLKNKFKKFLMTKHGNKHFVYEFHVQKIIQVWGWNEWDWILIPLLE